MKLQFFSVAILLSLVLFSCSKDDNPADDNVGHGKISGTIDGKSVEFKSVQGSAIKNTLTFSGTNDDASIGFLLPTSIEAGTYVYGEDDEFSGLNGVIYTDNNGDNFGLMFGGSGTLKITKHNQSSNKIEGSFEGKLNKPNVGSKNVTLTFSISYKEVK